MDVAWMLAHTQRIFKVNSMSMKHEFPRMIELIPEQELDDVRIIHRTVTSDEIVGQSLANLMSGGPHWFHSFMKPGTYCTMRIDGRLVMSDTWMERFSNQEIIEMATGDVLIAGLGIGMILTLLEDKDEVNSITVLEKNRAVIDVIGPWFNNLKIDIVHANVFTWQPTQSYDTIYFDIWPDIRDLNYEETKTLHKKYRPYLRRSNPDHFMQSWMRNEFRKLRRQAIRKEILWAN